jgi:integrase
MPCYERRVRRGDRYWFSGQYLGTRYHSKAIYRSKRECQQAEREKLKEIEERAKHPDQVPLKQVMDERMATLKKHHSKFYHDRTDRHFKLFRDFIGDVFVGQVTRAQVQQFMNDLAADLQSRKKDLWTANACIRELKALFNYAIDTYELNIRNPVKGIRHFPVNSVAKYIPTDIEIAAVRQFIAGEQKLLFDFVEETGCRIMEAIRLTWEDVDGQFVTLYTRKAKNQNLTSRKIPTPDCLKAVSRTNGKVFTGYHAYPRFLETLTQRFSWHSLRHRRASIWANEGMTLLEIMHRLGHSNIETTQRYLQLLGYRR